MYKVSKICNFLLKSNEDPAQQCPIASGGALNDSAIFHGSSSIAQNSPVPSSSASNGQPFTVIAAIPSTGMDSMYNNYLQNTHKPYLGSFL